MTATIALGVEYDGSGFQGWQWQRHGPSVQETLETALARVADRPVQTVAAGRTDAGVHATGQVASFADAPPRPLRAWRDGVNGHTGPALKVRWAREVDPGFNARHSAVARRYLYLYRAPDQASPLSGRFAWETGTLNVSAMAEAAQALAGEHDFSSFRASGCQATSAWRCVHRIRVLAVGSLVVLDIEANAFLMRMVRIIAGALWHVGRGEQPIAAVAEQLAARDRTAVGRTAPARGLYLADVRYPGYHFPAAGLPPLLCALNGLDAL